MRKILLTLLCILTVGVCYAQDTELVRLKPHKNTESFVSALKAVTSSDPKTFTIDGTDWKVTSSDSNTRSVTTSNGNTDDINTAYVQFANTSTALKIVLSTDAFSGYDITSVTIYAQGSGNSSDFNVSVSVGDWTSSDNLSVSKKTMVHKEFTPNASGILSITYDASNGKGSICFGTIIVKGRKVPQGPKAVELVAQDEGYVTMYCGQSFAPVKVMDGNTELTDLTLEYILDPENENLTIEGNVFTANAVNTASDANGDVYEALASIPSNNTEYTAEDCEFHITVKKMPLTIEYATPQSVTVGDVLPPLVAKDIDGNVVDFTGFEYTVFDNETYEEVDGAITIAENGTIKAEKVGSYTISVAVAADNNRYSLSEFDIELTVAEPPVFGEITTAPAVGEDGKVHIMVDEGFSVNADFETEGITWTYRTPKSSTDEVPYTLGDVIKPGLNGNGQDRVYVFTATKGEETQEYEVIVSCKKYDLASVSFEESSATLTTIDVDKNRSYTLPKLNIVGAKDGLVPTVAYAIKGAGEEEAESIGVFDAETGEVTLNGNCGSMTINATIGNDDYYNTAHATFTLTVEKQKLTVSFKNEEESLTVNQLDAEGRYKPELLIEGLVEGYEPTYTYEILCENDGDATIAQDGTVTFHNTEIGVAAYINLTVGGEYYDKATADISLIITPDIRTATFNFNEESNYGEGKAYNSLYITSSNDYATEPATVYEPGVSLTASGKYRVWQSGTTYSMRLYAQDNSHDVGALTLAAEPGYHITNIEIDNKNIALASDEKGELSHTTGSSSWKPKADDGQVTKVKFERGSSNPTINSITVTYELRGRFVNFTLPETLSFTHEAAVHNGDHLNPDVTVEPKVYDLAELLQNASLVDVDVENFADVFEAEITPLFTPIRVEDATEHDKSLMEAGANMDHLFYKDATVSFASATELSFTAHHAGDYQLTLRVKEGNHGLASGLEAKSTVSFVPTLDYIYVNTDAEMGFAFDLQNSTITPTVAEGSDMNALPDNVRVLYIDCGHNTNPAYNNGANNLYYKLEWPEPAGMPRRVAASADADGWTPMRTADDNVEDGFMIRKDGVTAQSLQLKLQTNGKTVTTNKLTIGNVTTAIEGVTDDAAAEAVYYDLQGNRVQNPDRGIYIRVVGGKADKVAF